jgi:hypothetical protein
MIPVKLPKEVLKLFPTWEYCCPSCSTYVKSGTFFCPHCKAPFDEKKWRVPPRFLKSHEAMSEYAHKVLAPKLSPEQRELLFRYFTEFFSDGFESGDFSAWTGTNGSPTIVESPVHHGSYAMESSFTGTYQSCYAFYRTIVSNPVFCRAYVRVSALPSNNQGNVLMAMTKTNYAVFLYTGMYRDSGGTLKLRFNTPHGTFYADHSFSADTWYCFEFKYYQDESAGEYRAYVDGSEVITETGYDTSANTIRGLRVGCSSSTQNGTWTSNVDCVVVADTYIGPETTEQTYTKTWTTDALFKRFDILKSFAVDARFGALMTQTISKQIDVLLKKLDATKTFGLDVYFGSVEAETYAKTFAVDVILAYKVRLPELWLDENGKLVLNISKPYTWVGA